jgi:hypothetical protein
MATSINPHLTDPALAPFLAPTFSPASYLNSALPALSPPSSLSAAATHPDATPLAALSTQTTTMLSTLDYQTQRLLSILTSLTDEILRLSPRLTYSVDMLRSDVVSLGEQLEAAVLREDEKKPAGLERLEMLAKVRERVEEVVKVFGEAMDWSIEAEGEGGNKKKGGKDPAGEVVYLLANGDLEGARKKVQDLRVLAGVFDDTVEGPARMAVVEKLEERVRAEMEKKEEKVEVKVEGKKEESNVGVYGLIEQLKGLRGMA